MRCRQCGYRLWHLPSRTCPECGADFLPSEFEFTVNSVQFGCPHCDSVYYGTSDKGHLVPIEFECTGCQRRVHMDQMILLPTAGVEEDRTKVDHVPWLERRERGFFRAWLATIGMALVQPGRLMRALPDTRSAPAAWWFAILTNTPSLLLGVGFLIVVPVIIALSAGGGTAPTSILLTVLVPLAITVAGAAGLTLVVISLWGLVTHALLRMTGTTDGPLRRTYEALCYSTGANVGTAVPCLGFYFGWLWWVVSAVIMVKAAQKVSGWRAALAVLVLPATSIVIVGGLYAWLMYSVMSGTGGWATAYSEQRANIVVGAMLTYAQEHAGQGPSHAFELIAAEYVEAEDLVTPIYGVNATAGGVKVGVVSPLQFSLMSEVEQEVATYAAIDTLPRGVTAHRLGDFVFVHHGIDFNTCDARLWIIVQSSDPASPATQLPDAKVLIGYCDGTVESVDDLDFSAALKQQNKVRGKFGLSPLSDPRPLSP